jgi:hypothetical protein
MSNWLAFLVGIAAILVAILIGVTQLKEGRNLICEKASILCERSNRIRLYSMDYTGSDGAVGDHPDSVWKRFTFLTSRSNADAQCVRLDLSDLRISGDPSGGQVISIGKENWLVQHIDSVSRFEPGRAFVFFFETRQPELRRDVVLSLDVKIRLNGADEPANSTEYRIKLPAHSMDTKAFCRLSPVGFGYNEFEFEIEDDFWHSDESVKLGFSLQYLKLQ